MLAIYPFLPVPFFSQFSPKNSFHRQKFIPKNFVPPPKNSSQKFHHPADPKTNVQINFSISDPDFSISEIDFPSLSDDTPAASGDAPHRPLPAAARERSLSVDTVFFEGLGLGFQQGAGGGGGRHKRRGSMDWSTTSSMFDGDSSTTTSLDYAKKAMAADKLAELALIDPKRARRILANRQSVGNLRLHPSAPLLIPRECSEQCQVHDYDIPAGTRVVLNAWAMGRDPMYWDEPEMFRPERFEGSSVD